MLKQPQTDSCFECRFQDGPITISLTRQGMPEQTFEARVVHFVPDVSDSHRFACGFAMFIERGESPDSLANRLLEKLKSVSPFTLDDASAMRLREVAGSWIMFNFRPALESSTPRRMKELGKETLGHIVFLGLALKELMTDVLLDETLGIRHALVAFA